jgi:cytochrome c oxidase assembly protein subunit 15
MFFFPVSQWVGGILYEHTHRLAGSAVGFLVVLLIFTVHGRRAVPVLRGLSGLLLVGGGLVFAGGLRQAQWAELVAAVGAAGLLASLFWPRGPWAPLWVRRMGWLLLGLVLIQGALGGLRVVLIKDQIGIAHAALAQLFFLLVCVLAWCTAPRWRSTSEDGSVTLRWWVAGLTVLVFVQLMFGAAMRHRHAGLAVPDFPKAHGAWWPSTDAASLARYNQIRNEVAAVNPVTAYDVSLHMVHRVSGVVLVALLIFVARLARVRMGAHRSVSRLALAWATLGLMQAGLGASTVWTNKSADVATAHVAVGALILALGGVLTVQCWRAPVRRGGVV